MRDGHLSGVFNIYSHIFNLLFDFAKWQQPHQIEPLLTAWCFCYGVVLNTAWMEQRKSFYGSKCDRPKKQQLIMKFKLRDVDKTPVGALIILILKKWEELFSLSKFFHNNAHRYYFLPLTGETNFSSGNKQFTFNLPKQITKLM